MLCFLDVLRKEHCSQGWCRKSLFQQHESGKQRGKESDKIYETLGKIWKLVLLWELSNTTKLNSLDKVAVLLAHISASSSIKDLHSSSLDFQRWNAFHREKMYWTNWSLFLSKAILNSPLKCASSDVSCFLSEGLKDLGRWTSRSIIKEQLMVTALLCEHSRATSKFRCLKRTVPF